MTNKTFLIPIAGLLVLACGPGTKPGAETPQNDTITNIQTMNYPTIGKIIQYDEALQEVIDTSAGIEVLAEGFTWSEGPVWVEEGQFLLFSDVPENKVYKWKEGMDTMVYLNPSGYTGEGSYSSEPGSNGLAIDTDGSLLLCQHGDRRVARMASGVDNPTSQFISLAESYNGKKFNSPNDLAVYKDGSVYFTDPPYGLPGRENSEIAELDFMGVYRAKSDGTVQLLTDALTRPNGIAFNPEYNLCFVNVSDPDNAVTMVYEVAEDGSFSAGSVFFNAGPLLSTGPGLPDGLRVHPSGTIFSTGPGGVLILSPEGKHLGTINTTQATANCAFNSDYSYLYMTADMYLLRVKLK